MKNKTTFFPDGSLKKILEDKFNEEIDCVEGSVVGKKKRYFRLGVIGRFRPLHLGGAMMLETLCQQSEYVIIGVGSANKYNVRNPFTAADSVNMIDKYLSSQGYDNYEIFTIDDYAHIPEFSDGQKWKSEVKRHLGELDAFITGNPYSKNLLQEDYQIFHPGDMIPPEKWIWLRGTMVRVEMAKGSEMWKKMVPEVVVEYLVENNLVSRFQKEFGLQTLACLAEEDQKGTGSSFGTRYVERESLDQEYKHTLEG